MEPRLLVIEDDATIGHSLQQALDAQGYLVTLAADGTTARRAFAQSLPDLVVLDLGLPDIDGVNLCRELRSSDPAVPILVLTARQEEIDVVVALDAGANDYVTKPFRLSEFLARVRAHLRRPDTQAVCQSIVVGDLRIDVDARRAWTGHRELALSPREFDLLALLASEAGRALTRAEIMDECWDEHWLKSTKTLDVHISRLRTKLAETAGPQRPTIAVLRRVGYRLDVP